MIRGRGRYIKRRNSPIQKRKNARGNRGVLHPMEESITKFVHGVLDIRLSILNYLPKAKQAQQDELKGRVDQIKGLFKERRAADGKLTAKKMAELADALRRMKRAAFSNAPGSIQRALYIYLFSTFDYFTGEIITALFGKKEELFSRLDRSVSFSDIVEANDLDDLKKIALRNAIEDVRRKSYADQFKWLESFFDIELRKWNRWPEFIEASQRRNLYVHCDGVVNEQYLLMCKQVEYKLASDVVVGCRLTINDSYFSEKTDLVMDAGVFLAHSLWRKVLPIDLSQADSALNMLVYEFLTNELWADAKRVGEFMVGQKKTSDDLVRRVAIINLAIANKFGGSEKAVGRILNQVDWSSSLPEFSMAIKVLEDDFEGAAKIMRVIGARGTIIDETSYHDWPLFREFRESDIFQSAYIDIFGHAFAQQLEHTAGGTAAQIAEAVGGADG